MVCEKPDVIILIFHTNRTDTNIMPAFQTRPISPDPPFINLGGFNVGIIETQRGQDVVLAHITVIALFAEVPSATAPSNLAIHVGMLIINVHCVTPTKTTREMFVDKSRFIMHLMSMLCGLRALQL